MGIAALRPSYAAVVVFQKELDPGLREDDEPTTSGATRGLQPPRLSQAMQHAREEVPLPGRLAMCDGVLLRGVIGLIRGGRGR
jgi:hypothetical protein